MKTSKIVYHFLVAICIFSYSHPLKAEDVAQTSIVEVQGIGKDADGALKSALYQAVQQAVGAYVDQETVIKNEEVIQDKLLSVAQGFVESYEIISPAVERRDGSTLWEIKIKAVVKKSEVGAALRTAGIMQVQADGSSGWAQQITMLKNREDAMALLEKLLPQITKNLICGRIIQDGALKTHEDPVTGDRLVEFQIEYDTNLEWWNKEAYPALDAALSALSLTTKPPVIKEVDASKIEKVNTRENKYSQPENKNENDPKIIQADFYQIINPQNFDDRRNTSVRIYSSLNKHRTSWSQKDYYLPLDLMKKFRSLCESTIAARYSNEQGQVLSENFTLEFCDNVGDAIYKMPIAWQEYSETYDGSRGVMCGWDVESPIPRIQNGNTFCPAFLDLPREALIGGVFIIPELFSYTNGFSHERGLVFNYSKKPIVVKYLAKIDSEILKETKSLKLIPKRYGVIDKSLRTPNAIIQEKLNDEKALPIIKETSPEEKQRIVESFVLKISESDRLNSNGGKLTDPVLILMQDRANVHRFQNPDGDDVDQFFNQADNRAKMRSFLKNGSFPEDVQKSILSDYEVKLKIRVYINEGKTCVDVSHQLQ